MKKVLIVKMTSMGDLIQTFPALTDAANAIPGLRFDWLADEAFQEIPRLHHAVDEVISVSFRRWKKNIHKSILSQELRQFLKKLRSQRYDMVIDAQSNLKSALVSLLTKGKRYGLDKTSVREYGAHWVYHQKTTVDRNQNHALRIRKLLAATLGYELPLSTIDYGINQKTLADTAPLPLILPERYIFVTAISSSNARLWPEPYWKAVFDTVEALGFDIVLPWWSSEEKERVFRLKGNSSHIHALPNLSLSQKALVLSKAAAAISLDTGLAHMAAALAVPNVSLYGPTNAKLTGTYGSQQVHVIAEEPHCSPCLKNNCTYQGESLYQPACLASITPQAVLDPLFELLALRSA